MVSKIINYDEIHILATQYCDELLWSPDIKEPIVDKAKRMKDIKIITREYLSFSNWIYNKALHDIQKEYNISTCCEFYLASILSAEAFRRFWDHAMHKDLCTEAQLIQSLIDNNEYLKNYILTKLEWLKIQD